MKCDYCQQSADPHYQIDEQHDGQKTGMSTIMCHTCFHNGVDKKHYPHGTPVATVAKVYEAQVTPPLHHEAPAPAPATAVHHELHEAHLPERHEAPEPTRHETHEEHEEQHPHAPAADEEERQAKPKPSPVVSKKADKPPFKEEKADAPHTHTG